jgi:membrane associated rhomboid family serine protease
MFILQTLTNVTGSRIIEQWMVFLPAFTGIEPWRLLTSAFLHGGVIHLLFNMYALWVVGSFLEQVLGRWRMAAIFLLSALGGSLACGVWAALGPDPQAWFTATVGASGGVFGLFGAMVWVSRRVGGDLRGILTVIVLNVIISFTIANISWQGHLGGLAVGLGLGAIYALGPPAARRMRSLVGTAAVAGALVVIAYVIAARFETLIGLG